MRYPGKRLKIYLMNRHGLALSWIFYAPPKGGIKGRVLAERINPRTIEKKRLRGQLVQMNHPKKITIKQIVAQNLKNLKKRTAAHAKGQEESQ